MIGKSIYKILHDDETIVSMVDDRISPNIYPEPNPPYITYALSWDANQLLHSSSAQLTYAVTITVTAKTYADVNTLIAAVNACLDRVQGEYEDHYIVGSFLDSSIIESYPAPNNEQESFYVAESEFEIIAVKCETVAPI